MNLVVLHVTVIQASYPERDTGRPTMKSITRVDKGIGGDSTGCRHPHGRCLDGLAKRQGGHETMYSLKDLLSLGIKICVRRNSYVRCIPGCAL
jgi:hypothetical protein